MEGYVLNRRLPIHQGKHVGHSFEGIDPCNKVYLVNAGKSDPLQQTRALDTLTCGSQARPKLTIINPLSPSPELGNFPGVIVSR